MEDLKKINYWGESFDHKLFEKFKKVRNDCRVDELLSKIEILNVRISQRKLRKDMMYKLMCAERHELRCELLEIN